MYVYFQILLERERSDRLQTENQLKVKTKELSDLQIRYEQERVLLNSK
jgi:hypothetical protein